MTYTLPRAEVREIETVIGIPFERWARQCHAISLAIVKARLYPGARVARGWADGVISQHSWVALGDPYDIDAPIVDATLWSYDPSVIGIWVAPRWKRPHVPHGAGSILGYPLPEGRGGEPVALTPTVPLSTDAQAFLDELGPLDLYGWNELTRSPMGGWPSGEIIAAMHDTAALRALVPIDILGMVTDRNPGGAYLP